MNKKTRNQSRMAFTLIELLIVVAIIAILAAIAVPNFLEAQTRAKVSRVLSDTRSLGTAVEMYAIDHNGKYSMCLKDNGQPGENSPWITHSLRSITTPISYISSLPRDPFIPEAVLNIQSSRTRCYPSYVYQWYDRTDPNNPHPDYPTYYSNSNSVYYPMFKLCVGTMTSRMWFFVSQGPFFLRASNGQTPSEFVDWKVSPYDASNGTMSRGIIVRTNTKA